MQNLVEILKQVPVGTKLWSNIFGEVELDRVGLKAEYPIGCFDAFRNYRSFTKYGYYRRMYENVECVLWPSKDHRAWDDEAYKILGIEKKPPFGFQPFDKVLVRDSCDEKWRADFFSHIYDNQYYQCVGCQWQQCIPYNDETKHLLGTKQEPPEKYRLSL